MDRGQAVRRPVPDLAVVPDELLARLAAAEADGCAVDHSGAIALLGETGYLVLPVPVELGGLGAGLVQVCHQQRRLARRAPALALAVNEHLGCVGAAADLRRAGGGSHGWLLEEAAAGEFFSGRIGGPGSLPPLAWAEATLAAVTTGIAERAFELGVQAARSRPAPARRSGRHEVARMAVELDGLVAHAERVADDWSAGVAHGAAWPAKLAAARFRAAEGAARIVAAARRLGAGPGAEAAEELDGLARRLAAPELAVGDGLDDLIGRWALDRAGCLSG